MAVYNGTIVRRNARELKIMTEAGSRLEKYMDPNSIPHAFKWLISLIQEYCGGTVESNVFDEYIQITPEIEITVNLDKVQQVAGIPITYTESKEYLKNLGFTIKEDKNNSVIVLRPVNRLDVETQQDVFEEIIRMKGFNNIPSNYLTTQVVKDITPSRIYLMEDITNYLAAVGLDEVRSWVLVDQKTNDLTKFINWNEVKVTNSINEEVPYLRQSIAVSLIGQNDTYLKNNINPIELFEIGKIFGKIENNYSEINSLGMLIGNNNINELKNKIEGLLRHLGIDTIEYEKDANPPKSAHPLTSWKIKIESQIAGVIYLTNTSFLAEACIAELNIDLIDSILNGKVKNSTMEVTQKIVTLDANITLDSNTDLNSFVLHKLNTAKENLWSWSIVDEYKTEENVKYTIRVSYVNLSDTEAKELHSKLFV
jgi:phenylalanyl-tRNA synthetase beta chain